MWPRAVPRATKEPPIDRQVAGNYTTTPHVRFNVEKWNAALYPGAVHKENCRRLLSKLIHGRDFEGAAETLRVMYRSFQASECIQSSLILLQHFSTTSGNLKLFYETLGEMQSIDTVQIIREFLFHLMSVGEFTQAFEYFREKIQNETFMNDELSCAHFGVLSYWLLLSEFPAIKSRLVPISQDDHEEISQIAASSYELFQLAQQYIGRAVAAAPEKIEYIEYYAQLLILKGDVELATDVVEDFYHGNSTNPQACRLLFYLLSRYYPNAATASQVFLCLEWIEKDPEDIEPIKKLKAFYTNGQCSRESYVNSLTSAIERCCTSTKYYIWEQLAIELTKCQVFSSPKWWKRVFFTRPIEFPTDSKDKILLVHKAAVAAVAFGMENQFTQSIVQIQEFETICREFHLSTVPAAVKDHQPDRIESNNVNEWITNVIPWPKTTRGRQMPTCLPQCN